MSSVAGNLETFTLSSPLHAGHVAKYAKDYSEDIVCKYCQQSYLELSQNEKPTVCCPFCPWLTSPVNECSETWGETSSKETFISMKHLNVFSSNNGLEFEWNGSQDCLEDVTMPVIVIMSDFEDKRSNNERWYSPVFCTHEKGYHFRLRVDANGWCGTGDAVAVVVSIVKGDHDDQLQWPFEGVITVQILNHISNSAHSMLKEFEFCGKGYECQQVIDEAQPEYGCWCEQFIMHKSLPYDSVTKSQYLKNDCLYFLVSYRPFYL